MKPIEYNLNPRLWSAEDIVKLYKKNGYSFRCEHKIFSPNSKRGPNCQEAAHRIYISSFKTEEKK